MPNDKGSPKARRSGSSTLTTTCLVGLLSFGGIASATKPGDAVSYPAQGVRPIDGDTIAFAAPWLPDPLKKELTLRIYGVDTPETGHRAKCAKERELGVTAAEYTKNAVSSATQIQVSLMDWDKYGGRVLGDLILNGSSHRRSLIDRGYAVEYRGGTKVDWCK